VLNVALSLVTIIGLPIARRGELNTAEFTFAGWDNLTGWPNGFAFILSFLAPVWTICEASCLLFERSKQLTMLGSFDCAVSISEEATNASIAVPSAFASC
jgi:hypothetical protein